MYAIPPYLDVPGLGSLLLGAMGIVFGLLVFVGGKIPAAIHAFKGNDILWGILLVTVAPWFPPLGVVYCLVRWPEGRLPCLVMLLGTVLIGISLYFFLKGFVLMDLRLRW